jgi:hypothetical protein
MKKILLLSMPFGSMDMPALGLSLFKARLSSDGIDCDVRYPCFTFADMVGAEQYHWISSKVPHLAFAGDWCFTEALYGPDLHRAKRYLWRDLKQNIPPRS